MEIVIYLLIFQGFLGAFDVFWNHEFQAQLPKQPWAALEQKIHGARELIYAPLFLALAWYQWYGNWIWLIVSLIVIEILLTTWDFIQEDRSRSLSPVERVTHLILSMTGGAYTVLLLIQLWEWSKFTDSLQLVHYGLLSYILSVLALGVFIWGIRDLRAGIHLQKLNNHAARLSEMEHSIAIITTEKGS